MSTRSDEPQAKIAWQLEDGDPGTAFAPAEKVKDQGAETPWTAPAWVEELHALTLTDLRRALAYLHGFNESDYQRGVDFARSLR